MPVNYLQPSSNFLDEEPSYYVDDGCHSEDSNPDDYTGFYQVKSSDAFVRCCSDDGTYCETISNCIDSDDLMSYRDAKVACGNNGMRLCTKDELLTDICCGTGGSCDNHLIWTSTYECVESDDCNEENQRGCRC